MRTLGIVPARAGSKRLPRKNVELLAGKPLVAWAIEIALKATHLDRVIVSSDDAVVLDIAAAYGADLPLRRPSALAGDQSPAVDYVRHALAELEGRGGPRFEAVAIIQPTSPLTRGEDVDGCIELLASSEADTAVTVQEVPHDLHLVKFKVMRGDRLYPYIEEERGRMSPHELPTLFVRNCAVYATRRHVVDAGAIIGADCRGYVMPRERSVDINDEMDLRFAEFLLQCSFTE